MYFSIGWEAELIIFVKWFKILQPKVLYKLKVLLLFWVLLPFITVLGSVEFISIEKKVNFTLPGICTSHITHQYFNVLIERDLAFIQYSILYLVGMHVDVYSTPQGACFRNVTDAITLRTPSLLCYIFICYCVIICATLYMLSMCYLYI